MYVRILNLGDSYLVSWGWLGADRHGPEALSDVAAQAHRPPAVLAPVAGVAKGVVVAVEPPSMKPTPENRVRVVRSCMIFGSKETK